MQKIYKDKDAELLTNICKNLQIIYTLLETSQEALDLCRENEKDCTHITVIMDIILDKFRNALCELENAIKQ